MTGSAGRRPANLVFVLGALVLAVVAVRVHAAAGLTLPVPWGDEAYFLWQARAFSHGHGFLAPELDAQRPLFLLPFGYGAAMGVLFAVAGFSLELARWSSLALCLTGFGLLAMSIRRHAAPLVGLALAGGFLLNARFVTMANVARMEAFLFAVVCGAMLLLERRRTWTAIALLSVTPMIHPNGVFYLVPVVVSAWLGGALRQERPDRTARILLVLSAAVWIANGVYALQYLEGFIHDTAYRLGETASRHGGWSQFGGQHAVPLALIGAAGLLERRLGAGVGGLLVFAVGFWLHDRVRTEQWYDPFGDAVWLLLALSAMRLATVGVASPRGHSAVAGMVGVLAFSLFFRSGLIEGPRNYLQDLQSHGMRVASEVPYFTAADREAIRLQIEGLSARCPARVEFYPWGDALLVEELERGRIRYQVPYFDPLFQPQKQWVWGYGPTPGPPPDLFLIRVSRYHPLPKDREARYLTRALAVAGVDRPTMFHARDSTEAWYAIRTPGAPASSACR